MYDELTRAIWIQIFNCGEEIFEPLEKLDQRFKLEDQYAQDAGINESMKKNVSTVMRALEGEVSLIHKHEKITQWKHNLLQRDQNDYPVSGLFNLHSSNSV